jgi:hypothetical protein
MISLSPGDLHGRVWDFGRPGEPPSAVQVRLFADGRLGGWWEGKPASWSLRDGRLLFLDQADLPTTAFDTAETDAGGLLRLTTRTDLVGLALQEVRPLGALTPARSDLQVLSRPGPRRRNLVVVPAGENSLHTQWPRDVDDADRNWDLLLTWYGSADTFGRDLIAEHQVLQTGARKFEAVHNLFAADSRFWSYDYIALPDDDMMLSWRDWNLLFATCRRFGLHLAQPAISGHINQPILHQRPGSRLRFTSWVEVQTPIFSREALRLCAPTFGESRSGYGLDHVWPKLLGEPEDRVAIIDAVVAEHTRPGNAPGVRYDYEAALCEGAEVQGRYGAPWRTLEFGVHLQRPRVRPPAGHPEEEPD